MRVSECSGPPGCVATYNTLLFAFWVCHSCYKLTRDWRLWRIGISTPPPPWLPPFLWPRAAGSCPPSRILRLPSPSTVSDPPGSSSGNNSTTLLHMTGEFCWITQRRKKTWHGMLSNGPSKYITALIVLELLELLAAATSFTRSAPILQIQKPDLAF